MAVTKAKNVIKLAAEDDAVTGNVVIHKIRWVGATTAGHLLNIQNTAGGNIFADIANNTNYSTDVDFNPPPRS
jgi:hypothetical protein